MKTTCRNSVAPAPAATCRTCGWPGTVGKAIRSAAGRDGLVGPTIGRARRFAGGFATLLLVLAAACDKASAPRYGEEGRIRSIAYLKSLCAGAQSVVVREEFAIRGRVTGNDRFGEFYKTLILEDDSGGIGIAADCDRLADRYPFGCEVTVQCNGLTLNESGGKIQLGTTPTEQGAGRIPRDELPRYLRVGPTPGAPPRPARLAFSEIGPRHTDTYVRFDGVRFPEGGSWCATDPVTHRSMTTEHPITDAGGRSFLIRAAGTCTYADEPVPSGTGSVCGIVDYFNGRFSLRITNYEIRFVSAATLPTTYP